MKYSLALSIIFLIQLHTYAIELNSENLKSLLEEKNLKISASKAELTAAQERQTSLGRSFLPTLDLHASQESFKLGNQEQKNEPTYGAEAKINIFNGGRDQMQSEIRSLQSQKKSYQLQRVQAEELEKARSLYWQILYAKEKTQLLISSISINSDNLKSADRRIRSGVATESDRYEFEMKAIELKQELDETKLKYDSSLLSLALMLGIEEAQDIKMSEKLEHDHDLASFLKHSPKDHEFLYKENELQASESNLEAASQKRIYWPKLDAFASYNQYNQREKDFPDSSDRTESAVGLRVSMSLGAVVDSTYESRALAQQALSSQKIAELQKQEIEVHIEGEVAELELLHSQVHQAEENISRAEKYYKLTQSEYIRGAKNSPDILGASEKLFAIQNKRIEIIRDFQIAKAHIMSKIGK